MGSSFPGHVIVIFPLGGDCGSGPLSSPRLQQVPRPLLGHRSQSGQPGKPSELEDDSLIALGRKSTFGLMCDHDQPESPTGTMKKDL